MMLSKIVANHQLQLSGLAKSWLASGAEGFAVWGTDRPLFSWPAEVDTLKKCLSAEIQVGGKRLGELTVNAPDLPANRLRLEAEANLIASLAAIDRDITEVDPSPADIGEQLLDLYQTIPTAATSLLATLDHVVEEIATRMQVAGAFVRAFLQEGPDHWSGYGDLPHDRHWLFDCMAQLETQGTPVLQFTNLGRGWRSEDTHLLLIAIPSRGAMNMVLGLTRTNGSGPFTDHDQNLARKLAGYAGLRIEYAILSQAHNTQAKLEFELKLAHRVQKRLLPKDTPSIAGLDLYAVTQPASTLGGDFYDFIDEPDSPFVFTVCDISGKGISAAMMVAMTRMVIRSFAGRQLLPAPASAIANANAELYHVFSQVSMLATIFLGQYEPQKRVLHYANAGHSPVVYYSSENGPRLLEADGPPVGVVPDSFAAGQQLKLAVGDVLLVGTDGLCEARNEKGEMFGYDALLRTVAAVAHRSAQEIADALREAVSSFTGGGPLDDDQTLLVCKGV